MPTRATKQSKQHESHLKPNSIPLSDGTMQPIRAYVVRPAEFTDVPYPVLPCIVHRAEPVRGGRVWTCTDVATGFAIGHGRTTQTAIMDAIWKLKYHGAIAYLGGLRRAGLPIGKLPFVVTDGGSIRANVPANVPANRVPTRAPIPGLMALR